MTLIEELLGCPLLEITRSYWAAKLHTGEWVSEARTVHDWYKGEPRQIDWYLDVVATGDHKRITELWLFCPPNKTSPTGNTVRMPITRPCTAFQFKVTTYDSPMLSPGIRTLQAQVIGRVENDAGDCTCFIWDEVEDGLLTPETHIQGPRKGTIRRDNKGNPVCAGKTNVTQFHSWRPSLAPIGLLALDRLGIMQG